MTDKTDYNLVSQRVTALETNMGIVLALLEKREDPWATVLKQLTVIEIKQDQFLAYQKTCDAERDAHGNRLQQVENVIARNQTVFATLMRVGGGVGGLLALALSAARILGHA